jgi:murein DD-endopeptidase MepM/ murein hydrolase activator NlpD
MLSPQVNRNNLPKNRPGGIIIDPKVPLLSIILVSILAFAMLSRLTSVSAEKIEPIPLGESIFLPPYDDYVITQGLHGFSYGHMAVDLSAGKGAVIKAPIHGKVVTKDIDYLGNTTLEIENTIYKVLLLHGVYDLSVGEIITAGQPIGFESNLGNTTDMNGISCAGRDCGYHTHLNVFHKLRGTNVNPLELMGD